MEFNREAAIEQEVELVIMYLLGSGRIILEHHMRTALVLFCSSSPAMTIIITSQEWYKQSPPHWIEKQCECILHHGRQFQIPCSASTPVCLFADEFNFAVFAEESDEEIVAIGWQEKHFYENK